MARRQQPPSFGNQIAYSVYINPIRKRYNGNLFCLLEGTWCNIPHFARRILDEGGLTGFTNAGGTFEDDDYRKSSSKPCPRDAHRSVDRLRRFIPEYTDSLVELAIKYHPGITTALVSMHGPSYADQNISALDKAPLQPDIFYEIFKYHRLIRTFYDRNFFSYLRTRYQGKELSCSLWVDTVNNDAQNRLKL
ncbi:hypothetical protein [Paenibacillus antri]|uniref:hypothetical protein n=1 Tax=Paenibacillus antri TaxID=2582848 RepID=UPI0034DEA635